MSTDFLQERIDATKALIVAAEEAVLALMSGAIQQYTMDTGQTRQVVTKANITTLNKAIDGLYNRYYTLLARQGNGGVGIVRPLW